MDRFPILRDTTLARFISGALLLFILTLLVSAPLLPAHAEGTAAPQLSLAVAMDAVNEAIRACDAKGYKVTVAVVNLDGIVKVQARSDGSPIHSQRFSFRKAYTIASMGPEFGVDTSSALIERLGPKIPNIASGSTDLLFLPGGVLIKSGAVPIGAIGVSGAPQSSEDEVCAQAAVDKIRG